MTKSQKEVKCKYCGKHFTKRGINRHLNACKKNPEKGSQKPTSGKSKVKNHVESDFKAEFLSLLKNYDSRLTRIEEFLQLTKKIGKKSKLSIDENTGYTQIKKIYSGIQEKIGKLAPVPILYERLHEFYSYEDSQITELLTTLFISNKIDLQPGTARRGKPLVIDGRPLYWFNILG